MLSITNADYGPKSTQIIDHINTTTQITVESVESVFYLDPSDANDTGQVTLPTTTMQDDVTRDPIPVYLEKTEGLQLP
jgi:hypothetical protein